MSLLESFYLLFESNADDVDKGAKKAEDSTAKLEQRLKQTDVQSSKLGSSLLNIARSFSAAILSSAGIAGIVSGIKSAAEYAAELNKQSENLGIAVETLDAWGGAVQKVGGTTEGFIQTLKNVSNSINTVDKMGVRPAAEGFRMFGIHITDAQGRVKNVLDLLPQLSSVFEKMSKARAMTVGRQLGLDEGTINLLMRGQREVDAFIRRQKELGVVTKQDAEIASKFKDQWEDTTRSFRSVFLLVANTVLPILTKLGEYFEKTSIFMRKHSDFIVGALVALGAALLYVVVPAAAAAVAAFWPFLLIGGIFALVYDDIQNFRKGNDSLIGDIVKKWPWVVDVFNAIVEGFKVLKADVISGVTVIAEFLGGFATGLYNSFKAVFSFIIDGIEKITSAYKSVKSFLGFDTKDINVNKSIENTQKAINLAATSPMSSPPPSWAYNNSNATKNISVNTGDITIQTQSTNPKDVADILSSELGTQMREAANNFDDGLMA